MIFLSNSQGAIVAFSPGTVNQGSIAANEIILLAPFPAYATVQASFRLPGGLLTYPRLLEEGDTERTQEEYPYTLALEEAFNDNLPDGFNVWKMTMDKALTERAGTLGISFIITTPEWRITTDEVNIPINKSGAYISAEVSEDDYSTISAILSLANTVLQNAEEAAREAVAALNIQNGSNSGAVQTSSNTANGAYAFAEGSGTNASGNYAHSGGDRCTVSGEASVAFGKKNIASGTNSSATGADNTSSGLRSHVEGYLNVTDATNAHIEGERNECVTPDADSIAGRNVHIEGRSNKASGVNSHVEGGAVSWSENEQTADKKDGNLASGDNSHVEGSGNVGSGKNSHVEGVRNTVSGEGSHAEGLSNEVDGKYSHAEGYKNKVYDDYSHVEGQSNTIEAGAPNNHVEGNDNILRKSSSSTHVEGSKNEVKASTDGTHVEGTSNKSDTDRGTHIEGQSNTAISTSFSHIEGCENTATGSTLAHIEGEKNSTGSSARNTHIEGEGNSSNHSRTHVGGLGNRTSGENQRVIGTYNEDDPEALFIVGNGTSKENRSNALVVRKDGSIILGEKYRLYKHALYIRGTSNLVYDEENNYAYTIRISVIAYNRTPTPLNIEDLLGNSLSGESLLSGMGIAVVVCYAGKYIPITSATVYNTSSGYYLRVYHSEWSEGYLVERAHTVDYVEYEDYDYKAGTFTFRDTVTEV